MTVEHFLQDCQTLQNLRADTWPADTAVREKLYGPVENLLCTAAYVPATGVPVWATGVPVWANDDDISEISD